MPFTLVKAPDDLVNASDLTSLGAAATKVIDDGGSVSINAITLNTGAQNPPGTNMHSITDVEVKDASGNVTSYLFQAGIDLSQTALNMRMYMSGTALSGSSFAQTVQTAGVGTVLPLYRNVPTSQAQGLFDAIGSVAQKMVDDNILYTPLQDCVTVYTNIYNEIRDTTGLFSPGSTAPLGNAFLQAQFGANQNFVPGDFSYAQWASSSLLYGMIGRELIVGCFVSPTVVLPIVVTAAAIAVGYELFFADNFVNTSGHPLINQPHTWQQFASTPLSVFNSARGLFASAHSDPIVIDLNGTGLSFTPLNTASPHFDFKSDGHPELTSWIGSGNGLLVTLGPNGTVTNGDGLITTFNQLVALDQNQDGVLDGRDPAFASLAIWVDTNNDAICEPGELVSLSQANIQSIGLNFTRTTIEIGGDFIVGTSVANMIDGSTRELAQVELQSDSMQTVSTSPINVTRSTFDMPFLNGYGQLDSLWIACGNDPLLGQMTSELTDTDPSQISQFDSQLEALLMRWGGIGSILTPDGSTFDAQKLAFMAKFFGNQNTFAGANLFPTLDDQTKYLQSSWNTLFSALKVRILVQLQEGPFSQSFSFDPIGDVILPNSALSTSVSELCKALQSSTDLASWINGLEVINSCTRDAIANSFEDTSAVEAIIQQYIPSYLSAGIANAAAEGKLSVFEGYGQGTTLTPSGEANLFIIDQANDTIALPYQGSNEILLVNGAENLTVENAQILGPDAIIQLDPSISNATLSFQGDGRGDFELYSQGTKLLTIDDLLTNVQQAVSEMRLGDGTVLTVQDLLAREENATTNLSGTLYGTPAADTLDGQGLATKLVGNGGGDTFVYRTGYGALEIQEQDTSKRPLETAALARAG